MLVLLTVVVLNVYLFAIVPKGFFPQQSSGALMGYVRADQSISFQAMQQKMLQVVNIVPRPGDRARGRLHRRRRTGRRRRQLRIPLHGAQGSLSAQVQR